MTDAQQDQLLVLIAKMLLDMRWSTSDATTKTRELLAEICRPPKKEPTA